MSLASQMGILQFGGIDTIKTESGDRFVFKLFFMNPKTVSISFPTDRLAYAFFGVDSPGEPHYYDCSLIVAPTVTKCHKNYFALRLISVKHHCACSPE